MKTPECPDCGGRKLQVLSCREGSEFFDLDSGELIGQTIYVFGCECGRQFAHAIRKRSEFQVQPKDRPQYA